MRVIVQRINYGRCLVDGQVVSSVNKGLMLLVSFTHKDDFDEIDKMAKKIANLRIFEDENQKNEFKYFRYSRRDSIHLPIYPICESIYRKPTIIYECNASQGRKTAL